MDAHRDWWRRHAGDRSAGGAAVEGTLGVGGGALERRVAAPARGRRARRRSPRPHQLSLAPRLLCLGPRAPPCPLALCLRP
eukprot:3184372-Rhodomonas_salina.1